MELQNQLKGAVAAQAAAMYHMLQKRILTLLSMILCLFVFSTAAIAADLPIAPDTTGAVADDVPDATLIDAGLDDPASDPTDGLYITPWIPFPGELTLTQNEELGNVIEGLVASKDPNVVLSVMPQVQAITAEDARIVTADLEPTEDTTPVGTGMIVQWSSQDAQSAVILVRGDCTGSGMLSVTQLVRMSEAYAGKRTLEGPYLAAVDFTNTGTVALTDLVKEAKMWREQQIGISDAEKQEIIDAAVALQTSGGTYKADAYDVVLLHAGDVIYGMLPGQSAFYTDLATVESCDGSYVEMYRKLQMLPHAEYGYRTQLGAYEVKEDMWVATGICLANSVIDGVEAGPGGGTQYVIPDYEQVLELTETVDLHE